jgi:hypothetical protein
MEDLGENFKGHKKFHLDDEELGEASSLAAKHVRFELPEHDEIQATEKVSTAENIEPERSQQKEDEVTKTPSPAGSAESTIDDEDEEADMTMETTTDEEPETGLVGESAVWDGEADSNIGPVDDTPPTVQNLAQSICLDINSDVLNARSSDDENTDLRTHPHLTNEDGEGEPNSTTEVDSRGDGPETIRETGLHEIAVTAEVHLNEPTEVSDADRDDTDKEAVTGASEPQIDGCHIDKDAECEPDDMDVDAMVSEGEFNKDDSEIQPLDQAMAEGVDNAQGDGRPVEGIPEQQIDIQPLTGNEGLVRDGYMDDAMTEGDLLAVVNVVPKRADGNSQGDETNLASDHPTSFCPELVQLALVSLSARKASNIGGIASSIAGGIAGNIASAGRNIGSIAGSIADGIAGGIADRIVSRIAGNVTGRNVGHVGIAGRFVELCERSPCSSFRASMRHRQFPFAGRRR